LNILVPEQYTPFWEADKCNTGGCRSVLCLMYTECTLELDLNSSLFFTTNNKTEKIYCEGRRSILRSLKLSQHDTLVPEFVIILIAFF
jgi:hypothetical protein